MADTQLPQSNSFDNSASYTIKARPTHYRGNLFRSRLEAKWAAFFDLVGFEWQYEPVDLGQWAPDFLIRTHDGHIYVEVKPISRYERQSKMDTVPGEHLLVGTGPWRSECLEHFDGAASIGWFHGEVACAIGITHPYGRIKWGLVSEEGDWTDRISGIYEGKNHFAPPVDDVFALWGLACEQVRRVY
ncbi:MAG TPA: hypothetical protein PK677_11310 [Acidiphilium sp.]|nr:hypothetical protein [Acidiphilium sp.]